MRQNYAQRYMECVARVHYYMHVLIRMHAPHANTTYSVDNLPYAEPNHGRLPGDHVDEGAGKGPHIRLGGQPDIFLKLLWSHVVEGALSIALQICGHRKKRAVIGMVGCMM